MYVMDISLLMWLCFFFFKQNTAYEMRISDWSSDVCSSDLVVEQCVQGLQGCADVIELDLLRVQGAAAGLDVVLHHLAAARGAVALAHGAGPDARSEERRVGKECVSTCRSRWST